MWSSISYEKGVSMPDMRPMVFCATLSGQGCWEVEFRNRIRGGVRTYLGYPLYCCKIHESVRRIEESMRRIMAID